MFTVRVLLRIGDAVLVLIKWTCGVYTDKTAERCDRRDGPCGTGTGVLHVFLTVGWLGRRQKGCVNDKKTTALCWCTRVLLVGTSSETLTSSAHIWGTA
jgi:hypothetical protein